MYSIHSLPFTEKETNLVSDLISPGQPKDHKEEEKNRNLRIEYINNKKETSP